MAQQQTKEKPTETAEALEEVVALARTLSLERLYSAADFLRFLNSEDEDDDWPPPDEEELADVEAFHKGDMSRFVTLEQARRGLDGE